MSIKQKYTWHDFLRDNPEHKVKKTKRTSPEGKKAFDAATSTYLKKFLTAQEKRLTTIAAKVATRREEDILKLKGLRKAKKNAKSKLAQNKVGRRDHALAAIKSELEKTKTLQKNY